MRRLRRRSYATVHTWLAGCYWEVHDLRGVARHGLAAARIHPPSLRYFAAFPVRQLTRSRVNGNSSSVTLTFGRRPLRRSAALTAAAEVAQSNSAKRVYFGGLRALGLAYPLLKRHAAQDALLVVNLHSISDRENPFWPQLRPELFDGLLRFLSRHCTVTTFGRLSEAARASRRPLAVLSFDDGYLDFLESAMPIMARYGIQANLNVIGECVETGRPPWIVEVCDQLAAIPLPLLQQMRVPPPLERLVNTSISSKERFGAHVTNYLKSFRREQGQAIWSEMLRPLGEIEVARPTRMLGPAGVRAAVAAGHEVGVHSYCHESMELFSEDVFVEDLLRAQAVVKDLGGTPSVYAFPNGSFGSNQVVLARRHGVKHVLLMGERASSVRATVHPRLSVRGRHIDEVVLRALGHRPPRRV